MDLFAEQLEIIELVPDAFLLKAFALDQEAVNSAIADQESMGQETIHPETAGQANELLADLQQVIAAAPFRHMATPGGFTMSVAMTNCGKLGWIADRAGYRYVNYDPLTDQPWPTMPASFLQLAQSAAKAVGYHSFVPDACLINRYNLGSRMSLHQDKDEQDFKQPIVSVSLGLSAVFQFGGFERADAPLKITLAHGDVVVWGGESRLRYHGILPLKVSAHPNLVLGERRINLTFRKAG